jgi:hypothetical protein
MTFKPNAFTWYLEVRDTPAKGDVFFLQRGSMGLHRISTGARYFVSVAPCNPRIVTPSRGCSWTCIFQRSNRDSL